MKKEQQHVKEIQYGLYWLISAAMLWIYAISQGQLYGHEEFFVARAVIISFVLLISPLIADSRKTVKRNTVYWLSLIWIIPFGWFIALCLAIFGKTEKKKEKQPLPKVRFHKEELPDNAIDKTFVVSAATTMNAVTTVLDSRVVRGSVSFVFKMMWLIVIVGLLGLILLIME